jgi:hypothetical protein
MPIQSHETITPRRKAVVPSIRLRETYTDGMPHEMHIGTSRHKEGWLVKEATG